MRDLSAQQTRQLIDCEQLYAAYRDTQQSLAERFTGSMSWKTVKGRAYLYRKSGATWKSLGVEDDRTREIFERFHAQRDALKLRRQSLDGRIREMAPVNRAMRLGRVPTMSARLIRKFEQATLLGHGLRVVGTHALYAYERLGGVQFGAEAITTMDIDLLFDARARLKLLSSTFGDDGLIGLLQSLDKSFRATQTDSFRAVNDQGYMVDLITPAQRFDSVRQGQARMGSRADDLAAVEIEGLVWLENVPATEQVVISESGYPLTIVVPDIRAFMCHKAWLAARDDRDALKRRRDWHQAQTLAEMLVTRLPSSRLDDPSLQAVPFSVLDLGKQLMEDVGVERRAASEEDWDG